MALLNQAIIVPGQLGKFFETLRGGQAPEKVNRQFLKDIGFSSSNHLSFVPLLKGLGFLSADGTPTLRYREMLDPTRWRHVLAEAIREAYGDVFVLKAKPTKADKAMILGKYKSTYNMSDTTADRAASTFLALLDIAGDEAIFSSKHLESPQQSPVSSAEPKNKPAESITEQSVEAPKNKTRPPASLHYNIQIHLPATKDIEVYNSIFRSLREHIID